MNIYNKLVNLASEAFDTKVELFDKHGNRLTNSKLVQQELHNEFMDKRGCAFESIDMKQACETRVVI